MTPVSQASFGHNLPSFCDFPLPSEKVIPVVFIFDVDFKIDIYRRQPRIDFLEIDIVSHRLLIVHVHGTDPKGNGPLNCGKINHNAYSRRNRQGFYLAVDNIDVGMGVIDVQAAEKFFVPARQRWCRYNRC